MAETVEEMLVRLTGDSSSYRRMLSEAQAQTQKAAADVEAASKKIEGFATGLHSFAGTALQALGALGLATSLKGAFDSFTNAERQNLRLTAAIEANGKAAVETMADYRKFANDLSNVTLQLPGATMAMFQQTEAMGLNNEAAKRVIANSVALASVKGGEASHFLRGAMALEQGNPQLLARMLGIRGIADQTVLLAKVQTLLTVGMKTAQSEFDSTYGRMLRLQTAFIGLSKEVGRLVADAARPLIEGLSSLADWFNALDPGVKQLAIGVFGFMMAVKMAAPITWTLSLALKGLLSPMSGTLGLLRLIPLPFAATLAIVTGLVALLSTFVEEAGGIGEAWKQFKEAGGDAWKRIKEAAASFWEYIKPVWQAFASLAMEVWEVVRRASAAAWEGIKSAAASVGDFISGVWERITGGAKINWGAVRDAVRDAFLFMEYSMSHFSEVMAAIWIKLQYGFVRFGNQIVHLFVETLPAAFKSLIDYISDAADFLAGKKADFEFSVKVPERQVGELERRLGEEAKKQAAAVAEGFDEFRRRKLEEFGKPGGPEAKKAADNATAIGTGMADGMAKGAKRGADKLHAVLFNSAEAIARMNAYLEGLQVKRAAASPVVAAAAAAAVAEPAHLPIKKPEFMPVEAVKAVAKSAAAEGDGSLYGIIKRTAAAVKAAKASADEEDAIRRAIPAGSFRGKQKIPWQQKIREEAEHQIWKARQDDKRREREINEALGRRQLPEDFDLEKPNAAEVAQLKALQEIRDILRAGAAAPPVKIEAAGL